MRSYGARPAKKRMGQWMYHSISMITRVYSILEFIYYYNYYCSIIVVHPKHPQYTPEHDWEGKRGYVSIASHRTSLWIHHFTSYHDCHPIIRTTPIRSLIPPRSQQLTTAPPHISSVYIWTWLRGHMSIRRDKKAKPISSIQFTQPPWTHQGQP